ncbi:hypothetical protein FDP41_003935 [Naegleria fowleri]|uniref:Uncharacterized protein n=1 Tax=Naegleria fowleri TaxID=5763 RepID=A0A6A5BRG1_NAEFO|nr:uncharacterized protein FDP41_003935 [Naegleria fowleri]KAF0977282.1 hypothetical protein FDP41_003935 [Naegleria fowleri]
MNNNNHTPSSDFNFTTMMMSSRNDTPSSPTSDFLPQDETPSTTSSFLNNHHQQHQNHQQQDDDRSEQTFLEDDHNSHIHSHHPSNENSDDDESNFYFDEEMSEEAKAKLIQKHKEMKVKRGRKIKYENSICLECEEDGHKSQGGIWCYEVDHHKNNKRAPKYVNCDECHKLVSGPKYTRHLNKCAPSGASTVTSNTNQTSSTALSSPGVRQGMNTNVIPVSGAVVRLAYDGGTISSNSNPHDNNQNIENQSNSSSLTMSSLNNQTSPRVIIGSQPVNQLHQNQMPNNQNNNTQGMMNTSAPTFVIMPNPATTNSNNNNAFIQQLQQGNNANFMLNNTNMMAMINGIGLQQQSSPHSPKSPGGSSTSLPTIVLPQQHSSALQQQQLINVMNRLSPQNNYPTSPNQLVQIAPGTFGMQSINTPNYIINNNGANPVHSPQHIIITSPNNTSSSPGGRPLDNNAANQTRAMTRLSPSLLVSGPVSPGQQQQFTKIIIPNAPPTSPHQQPQQGMFQQFLPIDQHQQQNFLSTSSFTTNTSRLSPSYQQALSPNQASWSGYDSSPGLSPGNQSNSAAQKKRKRNSSNAGSSQPSGSSTVPSEGDYVEIRDDLLKKINDENDDNVYSLRLYNETTKQYTVLMSTVHKPVKQLCSSKKRKKLNQILAPVLAKFGVDAETLVQIKEVRSLIKNNKKPSSFNNTNDNDSEDSDEQRTQNDVPIHHHQQQQQMLSQIVQPQQTMMGMLNDLGATDIPQLPSEKDFTYEVPDFNITQHNFLNSLSDPQQQQPNNE